MKVVYNNGFGGFSLSREAILLARKISGNPNWGGPCIIGDCYDSGAAVGFDYGYVHDIFRHDPVLVQVVDELGSAANGACASLAIEEIPDGTPYRIDEYDGAESVETKDSYDWIIP